MSWTYLNDIPEIPECKAIHCDTRDFYLLFTDKIETKKVKKLFKRQYRSEEFLIDKLEIRKFLTNLENISGGKANWRFLHFNNVPDRSGWDFKYLRFYRYQLNSNKFIVCNSYNELVKLSDLNEVNLDKEHLNTH
jgi:hypothetical protein